MSKKCTCNRSDCKTCYARIYYRRKRAAAGADRSAWPLRELIRIPRPHADLKCRCNLRSCSTCYARNYARRCGVYVVETGI